MIKHKKDGAKVWNNLGVCFYKEGFYKKALEAFKKAYFYIKKIFISLQPSFMFYYSWKRRESM